MMRLETAPGINISKKDKKKSMEALLRLASGNRKRVENYKFVREECYDR
ncbi:MAG: hypothetical protein LBK58_01475 [Prevotellaceae bacterium]|jgi:hypothetical protein|nr:hypothetical protein [Prevotellaceae bacterium]